MLEQQDLEKAITTLEFHRSLLGDMAVDTAVSTLHERLTALRSQFKLGDPTTMTVLVADLSGFTAMSEHMDAEDVRDTINALWELLDNVVVAWGGKLDKHTGDGLIALFGGQEPFTNNAEHAVWAALDMQRELALFNQQHRQVPRWVTLQMRIGIHCGPVFLSKMGGSPVYTAFGDTLALTERIESLAPVGSVLVSQEIYEAVQQQFQAAPWEADAIPGRADLTLYEVKQERWQSSWRIQQEAEALQGRLVGRAAELELLQQAFDEVILNGTACSVLLTGDVGVGKTRFLDEFERWLELSPLTVTVLRGRVYQDEGQMPYGLLHDILLNYFMIHQQSSTAVSRNRLEHGILTVLKEENETAWGWTHAIGQLITGDFADSPHLKATEKEGAGLRQAAFTGMVQFLRAITTDSPVILLLEDVQWCDEGSFAWLEEVWQACQWMPLFIVQTARPAIFEKRPSWKPENDVTENGRIHLTLSPLSAIDSRHLISDLLQKIPNPPRKLIDLAADGARGNPLVLEELLKLWIGDGVIVKSPGRWQVQPARLNEIRVPASMAVLLRTRFERLVLAERQILQQAAAIGRVFWDSAVAHLAKTTHAESETVRQLLRGLAQKGILQPHVPSLFPGTAEYSFVHDGWRDVAYATLPGIQGRVYHAQVAAWMTAQAKNQPERYAGLLAVQYERAGEMVMAAEWYGRSADMAYTRNEIETAVRHYRHALRLLPYEQEWAHRTSLNGRLGQLLRLQARFSEAQPVFEAMWQAAQALGDASAISQSLLSIFWLRQFQGFHPAALEAAQQAETAARTSGLLTEELALALMAKGWALWKVGKPELAFALGKEALSISSAVSLPRGMAFSNLLLGNLLASQPENLETARQTLNKAVALFRQLHDTVWAGLALGYVAEVAMAQQDHKAAEEYGRLALQTSREAGDLFATAHHLRRLAQSAAMAGDSEQAETYRQQADVLFPLPADVPPLPLASPPASPRL